MDPARILQIITNSTWMVTQLVGRGPVEFARSEYIVEVEENTRIPNLLQLSVRVQPQVSAVKFKITEGNERGAFRIDPSTGRLALTSTLDYEQQQQHELVVEARAGEATSETRVVVRVQDQNDHAPVFIRTLHETQITEEDDRHLPKVILTVKATDGDEGEHGRLRYSVTGDGIIPNTTIGSSFAVHPTSGAVLLLRPLDRDPPNGQAQWKIRVAAEDGEWSAFTDVLVNLKDINDNAPFFASPTLRAAISENTPKGSSVIKVEATDHDDPREGQNAQLTYSLEKNVIDESSGSPILTIHTRTGLITTALCCLDREKTPQYEIQVVATDGGGLKGTGTVVVDVEDVNDVPPRFSRPEWTLDVSENQHPDDVLATLTVVDQDVTNNFTFRVVPESGDGWDMFRVEKRRVGAPGGDLRLATPLDYEKPEHREGFRFRVEVTDAGEGSWDDRYHVDGAWVNLRLVDENDNTPIFHADHAHLTLPEDTPSGTHLTTFTAQDLDGGGRSKIKYSIAPSSDPGGIFGVTEEGEVRLVGNLDRETASAHMVVVMAADTGVPPRTATATLTIKVTDVNDNPPFLADPQEVQVVENTEAQLVATVTLSDPDNWRQGHGPPFTLSLDPHAPPLVEASVRVVHDKKGDEGRGVGLVYTVRALDREEGRLMLVPLVVGDAGRRSATVTLTLHVADLNDNPMTPAAKAVTVHTVKGQRKMVPLGRVYVQDPDDWDAAAKTYTWRHPQKGFFLDTTNGHLTMSASTPDGRYELGFLVNDLSQGQVGVEANVTVEVRSLSALDVTSATYLTLAADPYRTVRTDLQIGSSLLQRLTAASRTWIENGLGVMAWVDETSLTEEEEQGAGRSRTPPTTNVWVAAPGVYNLRHLLLYHRHKLAEALGVAVQGVGVTTCQEAPREDPHQPSLGSRGCTSGCWASTEMGQNFVVVDANVSSVVGPQVTVRRGCGCAASLPLEDPGCTPHTCLNGGRCIPLENGFRCICPYGTSGPRCKALSRSFDGGESVAVNQDSGESWSTGSWAWAPSIPACAQVHMSLEVLTASQDAILLYSGSSHTMELPRKKNDSDSSSVSGEGEMRKNTTSDEAAIREDSKEEHATVSEVRGTQGTPSEVVALELRGGRPFLLLDLGGGSVTIALNSSYSIADNTWHRIDVIWKDELVEMIVDLCSGDSVDHIPALHTGTPPTSLPPDAHICRGAARLPGGARILNTGQPLQVGGLAHPLPDHVSERWPESRSLPSFRGCLRNLRINRELVDLGGAMLARGSTPGCPEAQCLTSGLICGPHGRCRGSPGWLRCECQPGWTGDDCAKPTTPTSFLVNSYVKLALSFTPLGYTTSLALRFRTRKRRGQLVAVSSQHGQDRLALQLVEGQLCVLLQFRPDPARSLCLSQAQVTDGQWHTVAAIRQGSATLVMVDDGDGDHYNASVSLEGRQLLHVDTQDGVHVGGAPELVGVTVKIHEDYYEGCIDDLRVSGRSVPLPPAVNTSAWGQVGGFQGVEAGCDAPPSCANVTCSPPLACVDTWRAHYCGCGEGRVLSPSKATCENEDLCVWRPCLNGGSCFSQPSGAGYTCACASGFSGTHCHLPDVGKTPLKISLGALVAILVWCVFLLLLVCAFLLHQHHKRSALRKCGELKNDSGKEQPATPCIHTPNLLELQLLQPPRANGQPAWTSKNPSIADVDVLQVDATSISSCLEEPEQRSLHNSDVGKKELNGDTPKSGVCGSSSGTPNARDDLRNYAYEGEGSSPGSLSSCLESCSGSAKFLGGFREVAHMLES
ncbi:putative neural-cadherin 2 isoform X2 [Portunus trituberculatus]|uniref:putative neural-cadherin 2 isoform X2 n=1 Tax=Portunus trituberculatus TaxID=210409 RepID=UPI001E1D0974|nr:putative neural-cadherin 2 isoform X2 [Portunus trituberculatus]